MNPGDLTALAPLLVTGGAAVVVMLATPLARSHRLIALLALLGLAAGFGSLWLAWPMQARHVTPLLVVDHYALFYMGLVLAAAFIVAMLSFGYMHKRAVKRCEFYILLLAATLGAAVLAASAHFASFFLGLELLSVSLYALVAYQRTSPLGLEAGIKYLVLAGVSSAMLLFGMALVYATAGTMEFEVLARQSGGAAHYGPMMLGGIGLILAGVGFKLSLVPMHLWAPDVYQGAPAPVTAFIATVSKGAVFALLLRHFTSSGFHASETLTGALAAVAIASMAVGNLLALLQENLKRLLAYSSIAHMGYLLVALLASGSLAAAAVTYYLVAYFVTMLGSLGVVTVLSPPDREAEMLTDYRGLAWRRPWTAGVLTAMLLSLAGIPLTAGFVGKFYLLAAGVQSGLWYLVIVLVATSVVGLFFYLRVIVALYRRPEGEEGSPVVRPEGAAAGEPAYRSGRSAPPTREGAILGGLALAGLLVALLALGVYPAPLIRVIEAAVAFLP